MALLRLEQFPRFSIRLAKNRWADFIELLCLTDPDKEISLDDIITNYTQEEIVETEDGDEFYSEKNIKLRLKFFEVFRYIESRQNIIGEFYPFENIDKDTIKLLSVDSNKMIYIYFLFSSNTSFFINKTIPPIFTASFEQISLQFMKAIYPNFRNELFGTANKPDDFFYGGTLLKKMEKLAHCLNTTIKQLATVNPHNLATSGDKGLDIVSFYNLDTESRNASFVPFCMGQCSCSYDDWKNKQSSIQYSTWNNRINDLPSYHEYMFVPFPLRRIEGDWADEEHEEIRTIIVDRFRFFSLLKMCVIESDAILSDCIKKQLTICLEELDVQVI